MSPLVPTNENSVLFIENIVKRKNRSLTIFLPRSIWPTFAGHRSPWPHNRLPPRPPRPYHRTVQLFHDVALRRPPRNRPLEPGRTRRPGHGKGGTLRPRPAPSQRTENPFTPAARPARSTKERCSRASPRDRPPSPSRIPAGRRPTARPAALWAARRCRRPRSRPAASSGPAR